MPAAQPIRRPREGSGRRPRPKLRRVDVALASPRPGRLARALGRAFGRLVVASFVAFARAPVRSALATVLVAVAGVNGAVRATGGRPALLSLEHGADKLRALAALALHAPLHPFASCGRPTGALLEDAAHAHGVPASLVRAVAETESSLRPHVISGAGAMGLMQLVPDTARLMGVVDPFDKRQSAHGGARYLAWLMARYGDDTARVAAAYHAGPNAVPVRGPLVAGPETARYARAVAERRRELDQRAAGARARGSGTDPSPDALVGRVGGGGAARVKR